MMCCISKCLVVWNLNTVATTCRERSGGQGFLACNRFGEYINIAHAAMTAEGDNRVLMIKVVKDMMTNIGSKKSALPKMTLCPRTQLPNLPNISSLDILLDLLKFREFKLFTSLMAAMTKAKEQKQNMFEVQMYQLSDSIQDLAMAYGERQALEFCLETLSNVKNVETKRVFEVIFKLFALDIVQRDLGFYLSQGVINPTAAKSAL